MVGEGLPKRVLGQVERQVSDPECRCRRVSLVSEGLGSSLGVGVSLGGPVDSDLSAIDDHALLALGERLLGRLVVLELDVSDTTRLAGLSVHLDSGADDGSELLKLPGEERLVDSPRQVSDPERFLSGQEGRCDVS